MYIKHETVFHYISKHPEEELKIWHAAEVEVFGNVMKHSPECLIYCISFSIETKTMEKIEIIKL